MAWRSGSSPHTWGIRRYDAPDQQARRFIPTYVGHTCATSRNLRNTSVHPHIRGAYGPLLPKLQRHFGSSPHTWGIRSAHLLQRFLGRFIPTYVGHTQRVGCSLLRPTVHPHIRGAYDVSARSRHRVCGSSPHTWGIRFVFRFPKSGKRFIPTYVGHTFRAQWANSMHSVHPHIRGAYRSI